MSGSRTIIIGGGGIGGLTAAIALAQRGFRTVVLDQAERPEGIGAGIQLTPNATRVLEGLGLGEKLRETAVVPGAVRVLDARHGAEIVRIPFADAQARYGAPYWVMHRGDLYQALLEAARTHPDVSLEFGARVETFASHGNGVTVKAMRGRAAVDAQGIAFVAADGIWSNARGAIEATPPPRFAHRVAWRATVAAETVLPWMREPNVTLWLGHKMHLVHYPVRAGREVNIVAIAADRWTEEGWNAPAEPREVKARFAPDRWSRHARDLIGIPEQWLKWALAERPVPKRWGHDQITLLGDAAHPMLPFVAQGAAMAIEDAAVLARHMVGSPDDPESAMRRYEADRRARTVRVQRTARRNGKIYQYGSADAFVRNFVMRRLGGERIRRRYDWIYGWRDEAMASHHQEQA